jgi:hypothetical protein
LLFQSLQGIVKEVKKNLLEGNGISSNAQTASGKIQVYLDLMKLRLAGLQRDTFLRESAQVDRLKSLRGPARHRIQTLQRVLAPFSLLMNELQHSLGTGIQIAAQQEFRIS